MDIADVLMGEDVDKVVFTRGRIPCRVTGGTIGAYEVGLYQDGLLVGHGKNVDCDRAFDAAVEDKDNRL